MNDISYFEPSEFSGTLYHYDVYGNNTTLKAYHKGELLSNFSDKSITKDSKVKNLFGKHPSIGEDTGGRWVLVTTQSYTDWYANINGGSTLYYTHSTLKNVTTEWVWVSGSGGGGGIGEPYHRHFNEPHGPSFDPDNHLREIKIDTSFSNINKINCTYKQLLKNTTIKKLLKSFFGSNADYDLTFKVEENLECGSSADPEGCTRDNLEAGGAITIKIDKDYINNSQTPTLFIAQTIIHEAIHANLYLALYNHNNGSAVNLPGIDDFPAIYEKYRQLKGWQHEFMANRYINLISQTLQEIHPLLNDQTFINSLNNDYPDMTLQDFYTSIAYLGLNGTTGQTNYLSNPDNAANYSISYEAAKANSTKTPNCN